MRGWQEEVPPPPPESSALLVGRRLAGCSYVYQPPGCDHTLKSNIKNTSFRKDASCNLARMYNLRYDPIYRKKPIDER